MAYRRAPENALPLRGGACTARQLGRRERRALRADSGRSPARARTSGVTGKHATATQWSGSRPLSQPSRVLLTPELRRRKALGVDYVRGAASAKHG